MTSYETTKHRIVEGYRKYRSHCDKSLLPENFIQIALEECIPEKAQRTREKKYMQRRYWKRAGHSRGYLSSDFTKFN